ncbi:MAG: nucleoside triphosphate pyrophosphohydrolase [Anaerolineae bacterium]|nr:nucleoside triphosphate pyrophosphohydrolase [Anaerolineae bacterium]
MTMSLRTLLSLLPALLDALGIEDATALQFVETAGFAGLHHPPLNPDLPALLAVHGAPALADVRRVLLNQYPAEHPIQVVKRENSGALSATLVPLSALDAADIDGSLVALMVPALPQASSLERFQETIAHLRAPEGCPWDRKQTHESLRPYLLEETYEVLDALDSGDAAGLREEMGDLLLQIVLHSQIAVDHGEFRLADVIATINEKIIRRHPHVWGAVEVDNDEDVKVNWDRLKQAEKSDERTSRLEGVSKALPALTQSFSYQDRAARAGFDWPAIQPVLDKLREELGELLAAETPDEKFFEMGDVLFVAVNLARWMGVDPESALRAANQRFFRRFHYIEQQAVAQGRVLDEMTLAEMDALWDDAKANGL